MRFWQLAGSGDGVPGTLPPAAEPLAGTYSEPLEWNTRSNAFRMPVACSVTGWNGRFGLYEPPSSVLTFSGGLVIAPVLILSSAPESRCSGRWPQALSGAPIALDEPWSA